MKRFFFLFLFLVSSLFAQNLDKYFGYIERYPQTMGKLGKADQGEIEIVLDRELIAEIESRTGREIGIVAEDRLWIWVNDAVKFPSGRFGYYPRIVFKTALEKVAGVAVIPILPNGKIVLNRMYRHATRSWEYEIPRGGVDENETPEQAAIREVREEAGMIVEKLIFLGEMNGDSGITNLTIPVYFAKVMDQTDPEYSDFEVIAGVESFPFKEIKQGFLKGYLTIEINGVSCQVRLRDPFLAFCDVAIGISRAFIKIL